MLLCFCALSATLSLVQQIQECSMNKQEKTTPTPKVPAAWWSYTPTKEQQCGWWTTTHPKTTEQLQKVGGGPAELTWWARGWGSDTWLGHSLQRVLLPAPWSMQWLPSLQTAPVIPSPLHRLHTSSDSSRCAPLLKTIVSWIFASILPSHQPPAIPKGLKFLLLASSVLLGSRLKFKLQITIW